MVTTTPDAAVAVGLAGPDDLPQAGRVMRQVLAEDLGGYVERWHRDLDDLGGSYLGRPGVALFVARRAGQVVGTAAVRPCRLASPPNPAWLAARFNRPQVCELRRVWVPATARRGGVGRALVRAAAAWAVRDGGYTTVYFHTDTGAPGAEAFWRAMPAVEVHDARPDPYNCVHFIVDLPVVLDQPDLTAAQ